MAREMVVRLARLASSVPVPMAYWKCFMHDVTEENYMNVRER